MEKRTAEYEVYEDGEPVQKTETVYLAKPVYADALRAQQAAKAWSEAEGIEPDSGATLVLSWVRKNAKGKRFTYDEIMQMEPARVHALYAVALIGYMGVRQPGKKSPPKKSSGAS